MDAGDFNFEQLDTLYGTVRRHLRFYGRLRARMDRLGWEWADPVRQAVERAYDAVHGLELRERLAVLRIASSFSTHGAELCRLTFGPLMQAAYLAGRDRGRRETGAPQLPEADRFSIAVVTADPGLCQDLQEVAECVTLGTDQMAEVMKEATGEEHAAEVLTKWGGSGGSAGARWGWSQLR